MAVRMDQGQDELSETHEINVTPFIDVMLVLLIVFMVAAPLATVDVNVELPASTARAQPRPEKPIFLSIQADQALRLGDVPVATSGLAAALDALSTSNRARRIFLRADKSVSYDMLMQVMNELRAAGYLKIALVGTDTGEGQ